MQWGSLLVLSALAPFASALLRFPCAQLVTERSDPLVTPGQISPHVHQIVGGNAFNLSMPIAMDVAGAATCTTCRFKEDFSNYWTAVLYFKARNGSYLRVPQKANLYTGNPEGGVTAYYIQPIVNGRSGSIKVTAPPKGFRMIVGNPMVRQLSYSNPNSAQARALTFRCFGSGMSSDNSYPHPGTGPLDTIDLPKKNCAGGIRSNIFFPSCWDGKNVDVPDHTSHVTWPTGDIGRDGHFFHVGTCPSSHPVRLPLVLYEIVWDTNQYANQWPTDGSQPFVFSMGDPTGFGQHGDYLFGWKDDSLQRAMDKCTDIGGQPESCRELTVQNDSQMNSCKQKSVVNEVVEGQFLPQLPGCNPVQNGPGSATMVPCGGAPTSTPITVAPPPVTSQPPPVTAPPPPATTAPSPLQTQWGQCGGQGWNGPTQCQPPATCKATNQYYSQCV